MITEADISERAVVGAMLTWPQTIAEAASALSPSDFRRPSHRVLFTVLVDLWGRGVTPDMALVLDAIQRRPPEVDIEPAAIIELMGEASSSRIGPHCRNVADYAARDRLRAIGEQLMLRASDLNAETADIVADTRARLDTARGQVAEVCDVVTMDDFCGQPEPPTTWAVPGLIDVEDRVVIVAPEGMGKTMLMRQIALAAGQGLHPFAMSPMPAITTLLVDLENPGRIVRSKARPMLQLAKLRVGDGYEATRTWIWHRPGGIDLRTRSGAAEFDAVCNRVRPRLVCLGPLYKAYRADSGKREHDVASEVAAVLDDLRTRHGFGLVLEAHAPLKQGGVRDLRPFGSLLWQQWPEVGIKLIPEGEEGTPRFGQTLKVGTWRGSRDERPWPDELHRGRDWPWEARWNDGYR